ncbi:iron-sulfur binding hydrogenase [uncultured Sphaerochaeta sp.]|uniref:iron-sulfur binding hydrogenase n=1 Tax=uncultured Sphaerochaeta sp. TaxID=886478 RepID=UPI002A0A346E|nr:iron-sulfur binding hydrogenase [uncultured Sphaerochaeta sp.]
MQVNDLSTLQGYKTLTLNNVNVEITDAYTGDLLSDVMGNAPSDSVLITIQAHKNTVAVASLAGIHAIVICNGRTAPDDMLIAAKEEDISVFATTDSQFAASCKVAVLLGKVNDRKN